jgi:acyl-CoA thioesterase I
MQRCVLCLVLAVLVTVSVPFRTCRATPPDPCAAPADFTTPEAPLLRFAAAIKSRGPVNVLAIGSAATVGDALGGGPHGAFPDRMVDALQAALPKVTFRLILRGGRGMSAADMLPLLETAVASQHVALVLWQTGTVEAVRGEDPDVMLAALQEGVQHARDAGADVVLIDPQFSRFLRANTDLDPYETALQQVAVLPGVVLFHRFDVMKNWAEDGTIDLERVSLHERAREMALLNSCLGSTLARFVLTGAGISAQ